MHILRVLNFFESDGEIGDNRSGDIHLAGTRVRIAHTNSREGAVRLIENSFGQFN